jgi:hypothetical protein
MKVGNTKPTFLFLGFQLLLEFQLKQFHYSGLYHFDLVLIAEFSLNLLGFVELVSHLPLVVDLICLQIVYFPC